MPGKFADRRNVHTHTRIAVDATYELQEVRAILNDLDISHPQWDELAERAISLAIERDDSAARIRAGGQSTRALLAKTTIEAGILESQLAESFSEYIEIPDFT